MSKHIKTIATLMTLVIFFGCQNSKQKSLQIDPSEFTEINVKIKRYGKALFEIDTTYFKEGLIKIQPEFTYFLDADLNDTANINQLYSFVSDSYH